MSEAPLITVGIVARSEGAWLRECWESLLVQTDSRWEAVLVLDAGGDDATRKVFHELDHPKLRKFVFDAPVGHYITCNKSFELGRTRFHFLVDGKDQLLPGSVSVALAAFERTPEADYVYGDLERFGGRADLWTFATRYTAEDLLKDLHPPYPCAYKKTLWERLAGYAPELTHGFADADFFIGAYEANARGLHCGQPLYRFRADSPGSPSPSYRHTYHYRCEVVIRRHPTFFALEERRRRYRAMGYAVGAFECDRLGLRHEAARCAIEAMRYQEGDVVHRILRNWRYFSPRWVRPAADYLLSQVKNRGKTVP